MKKIIYHNRDFDGIASAAILKKCLNTHDENFIGWDYGMAYPNFAEWRKDTTVFMVDISFPFNVMEMLHDYFSLVWIDHHKSVIDEYSQLNLKWDTVHLDPNYAGCELTWMYAYPEKEMPKAIKLLGIYDTWRKGDNWYSEVMPFQMGLKTICRDLRTFPMELLEEGSSDLVNSIIENGKNIVSYQNMINKSKCALAYERKFEGLNAIILNENVPGSVVFDEIWDENKYDIMISYCYNGTFYRVSLYTTKSTVDVSEICKKYGGGGHKKAAGFIATNIGYLL